MQPAPSSTVPAPAPPSAPQNEFGAGRVIAHTFSSWWRHVVVFSLLTLVADLPIFLVSLLSRTGVPGVTAPSLNPFDRAAAASPPAMPSGIWLAYLVSMLLFLVEAGAITRGVIDSLAGKRVSLGAMIGTGFRRALPLLVVGLLTYLMISLGLVLLIVPGVLVACALAVAIPAVVVERPGILGAIKRSFALTKGKRFAIFVAFLVIILVMFGVTAFAGILLPLLTRSFAPMLGTVLGLAINVVFGTLFWVAPGVVYHDLRVAKEGMETAQLAAVFE